MNFFKQSHGLICEYMFNKYCVIHCQAFLHNIQSALNHPKKIIGLRGRSRPNYNTCRPGQQEKIESVGELETQVYFFSLNYKYVVIYPNFKFKKMSCQ